MIDPAEFTHSNRSNRPALYHDLMLANELRMRRYREAITQAVRPGDLVAELGNGLGSLAIVAAQAGA